MSPRVAALPVHGFPLIQWVRCTRASCMAWTCLPGWFFSCSPLVTVCRQAGGVPSYALSGNGVTGIQCVVRVRGRCGGSTVMRSVSVQPTVAEVLALEPVRSGAPRVLTGADRLDAPVRWVHVIELAQAAHLLRGGELVLSTGIALPADSAGLQRYVSELAAVGVSALAVELGSRFTRGLPAALVSAAAEHRLPL